MQQLQEALGSAAGDKGRLDAEKQFHEQVQRLGSFAQRLLLSTTSDNVTRTKAREACRRCGRSSMKWRSATLTWRCILPTNLQDPESRAVEDNKY